MFWPELQCVRVNYFPSSHHLSQTPHPKGIWGQDFGLCCSVLATCSCAPKAAWLGITWPVYSAGSGERGCVQGLINHDHFGRDKQLGPSGGADTKGWPEGTRGDGGTGEQEFFLMPRECLITTPLNYNLMLIVLNSAITCHLTLKEL